MTSNKISSIQLIPSRADSMFSENVIPLTDTYCFTDIFDEWKTEFLNRDNSHIVSTSGLLNKDLLNIFPNLSKFNYYMMAPVAMFNGVTIQSFSKAFKGISITDIRNEIDQLVIDKPYAVLYSISQHNTTNPNTYEATFGYKIRYGLIE